MSPLHQHACANRLLATLPAEEWTEWQPHLEQVQLLQGQVLLEQGEVVQQVHFPGNCLVSLTLTLADCTCTEVALVGHEGLLGLPLLLGRPASHLGARVLRGGDGLCIAATRAQDLCRQSAAMSAAVQGYALALMTQMAQLAACNRHHPLEQRLCRWLLQCCERMDGPELAVTQEFMAGLLGVRRERLSVAAMKLQGEGLIRYARGRLSVVDPAGLQTRSCECHSQLRIWGA